MYYIKGLRASKARQQPRRGGTIAPQGRINQAAHDGSANVWDMTRGLRKRAGDVRPAKGGRVGGWECGGRGARARGT